MKRGAWFSAALVVVAAAAGCKKDKKTGEPSGSPSASPTGAASPAPTPAGAALPALDLKAVAPKQAREARKLNVEGLKLHNAKDYTGAQTRFSAALSADPGNLMARYNLACAYNMAGDGARGLALLKEIKDAGCPACLGRMVRAREDSDWDSQRASPEFKALTEGVEIDSGSVPKLAADFEAAWRAGKLEQVKAMIDARKPVRLEFTGGGCDENCPDLDVTVTGFDAVQDTLGKHAGSTDAATKGVACSKGCCVIDYDDSQPDLFMMSNSVAQICFSTDSGGVTTLSKLVLMDGGI